MNLKDICVDLEIAKELKEKGFPQDSLYSHVVWKENKYKGSLSLFSELDIEYHKRHNDIFYSAPTADEILKEFDKYNINYKIIKEGDKTYITANKRPLVSNEYPQCYCINEFNMELKTIIAKMWIYLKDNDLLEGGK